MGPGIYDLPDDKFDNRGELFDDVETFDFREDDAYEVADEDNLDIVEMMDEIGDDESDDVEDDDTEEYEDDVPHFEDSDFDNECPDNERDF